MQCAKSLKIQTLKQLSLSMHQMQAAAGPLQVCAGHLSGCEAAVYAMRQIFENPVTEAALLVNQEQPYC